MTTEIHAQKEELQNHGKQQGDMIRNTNETTVALDVAHRTMAKFKIQRHQDVKNHIKTNKIQHQFVFLICFLACVR